MRTLAFLGAAISVALLPATAEARSDSKPTVRHGRPHVVHHRWGPRLHGRWYAGWNAPGGWTAWRRPTRGFVVHPYWVAPAFYIQDWRGYGLAQPPYGLAWSRYYDDAVLIDGRGLVYDSAGDVDWDDYRYREVGRNRREDGAGGAIVGGVVGAIAGNRIAGRGNRLGGTLIGAGVGALAGMAIDKAEDDRRAPPPPGNDRYDYDFGALNEGVAGVEGRWTGRWDGRYVDGSNTRYEGTFNGTYEGPYGGHAGAGYPGAAPGGAPYGYMMVMQPVTTTTTTTTYEE